MTRPLSRKLALDGFHQARVRAGYSPSTYKLELRSLAAILERLGKPLGRIRRDDILRWLAARRPEVAPNTVARELCGLRVFFQLLVDDGRLPANPVEGLEPQYGRPAGVPLLLTTDTVRALLGASAVEPACSRSPAVRRALGLRNRALIELLYGLGLRGAEVSAARVADLDLQQGNLLVRRAKRGDPRPLPLSPAALTHVTAYLHEGRPHLARGRDTGELLLTERGTPVCRNEVYRLVCKSARRAGVRAHPHALRRAVATHLARDGVNLVAVQELLGHVRLDTTQRYVLVEREDLRKAVDALDQLRHRCR